MSEAIEAPAALKDESALQQHSQQAHSCGTPAVQATSAALHEIATSAVTLLATPKTETIAAMAMIAMTVVTQNACSKVGLVMTVGYSTTHGRILFIAALVGKCNCRALSLKVV